MSSQLLLDNGNDVGSTPGNDAKHRVHTKVANKTDEPIPASVQDLPLPPNAATASNQEIQIDELASITGRLNVDLSTRATEGTLLDLYAESIVIDGHIVSGNTILSSLNAKITNNFGDVTGAIRVAAEFGNASGMADFGSGSTSAQTIRVASNTYDGLGNAISSRAYDTTRPIDVFIVQTSFSNVSYTTVTPTANTSTTLIAENSNRKWALIINGSGANYFLHLGGGTAVINQGYQLNNNQNYEITLIKLYTGKITGIVGSNNRTIEIYEGS